ncbi:MAG: hypothetical protein DLM65_11370, partial [Candidatus Aeolococcus gillhamiae]
MPAAAIDHSGTGPRPAPHTALATAGLLAVVVAASFGLRVADLGSWLWIDEGTTIGVASHRLSDIPRLLARDGSPPLYYILLHGWMALFGTSEQATHSLS